MIKSGRPELGEYASYAQSDIDLVQGDDIVSTLESQIEDTLGLLAPLEDTPVFAPGKWTLKQAVHHLSDDERIFAYRCLCLARNDPRPLEGFDEKLYAAFAGSDHRPYADLLDELRIVRVATIALLRGLSPEAWLRRGIVNGYSATVRGLAFHIAGHELHHIRAIRERYLAPAP
jgi:DinB superfamily